MRHEVESGQWGRLMGSEGQNAAENLKNHTQSVCMCVCVCGGGGGGGDISTTSLVQQAL